MRRFIPIFILAALMVLAYFTSLHEYFSYESLQEHRASLKTLVGTHPISAPFLYIFAYMVSTALSIPGGLFLSIFGGFLFPQPYSTIFVVTGATLGATLILKNRAGPLMQKMRAGFHENAANYLLFLRLVPIFPFWVVNLAPAFFGVSLFTFAWTTFFGIIPGAFVFTQAGVGLGAILDAGEALSVDAIFNNQIKIALIALGIFALLPVFIKKLRKKSPND
ncbi:MAG: TVP38/TMEM64 family protein [Waddliaceae bacterium]